MTLTQLRYIDAVAREKHFGRAANACFVSQPTLSVAIRKLEDELGLVLFERGPGEATLTPVGAEIVEQARRTLEGAAALIEISKRGQDPLHGTLALGAIYTVAPYLLPHLVKLLHRRAPRMPLRIEENYTAKLAEMLRSGELDVIIVALPFDEPGLMVQALYDEPFVLATPAAHPWSGRKRINAAELAKENLLLLGSGHCFRDHVLNAFPTLKRGTAASGTLQRTMEGGSLETIRHMVASGVGVTVLPSSSVNPREHNNLLRYIPFERPVPDRRIVLAWRRSFPRRQAIELLRQCILAAPLSDITPLDLSPKLL
jgi:LysR family hydrogen peroxide-inducible transcriptional activator